MRAHATHLGWMGAPHSHSCTLRWHRTEPRGSNHYLPPPHTHNMSFVLRERLAAVLCVSLRSGRQRHSLLGPLPFPCHPGSRQQRDWHSDSRGRHQGNQLQTREGRHQGNRLLSPTAEIALESKTCHRKVSWRDSLLCSERLWTSALTQPAIRFPASSHLSITQL